MKPVILEFNESDEHLSSHRGLALIGALLARTKLKDRISEKELTGCREPKISRHARKWFITFGRYSHRSKVWLSIYTRFREPVTA